MESMGVGLAVCTGEYSTRIRPPLGKKSAVKQKMVENLQN